MPITIGGYGQFYGNPGGGNVGATMMAAQQQSVNFARMVELEKLNLQKRALREREASQVAQAKQAARNYDLAQSRLAMEQLRLEHDDAVKQAQREAAEERYRQTLLQKEQERQDALRRYEAEQAYRQQQLDMQRQRQESLDNYRESRLEMSREKQAQKTASAPSAAKTPTASASASNSVLDEWIKGMEDTKKTKSGWLESQAKAARKLAEAGGPDADAADKRATMLENWTAMDENHRYGDGGHELYNEVKENTWSGKEEKILAFGKRFRQFAKLHPEIYTEHGFQPLFETMDWDSIDETELDALMGLMGPYASKEDVQTIVAILGGPR